jgi:L-amino acid N-acyltransferase YncA
LDIIRKAEIKDLIVINEIYNQAVDAEHQTADIKTITMDMRQKWYLDHDVKRYPLFVFEKQNKVIGWCSLSAYRKGREALEQVAEVSYYVHKDFQRQGTGSKMLKYALQVATNYKFETIIAILLGQNAASIKLLEKFGFKKWGTLPKVANFNGAKFDHLYYGLKITKIDNEAN